MTTQLQRTGANLHGYDHDWFVLKREACRSGKPVHKCCSVGTVINETLLISLR